jgi:hypothetical protein
VVFAINKRTSLLWQKRFNHAGVSPAIGDGMTLTKEKKDYFIKVALKWDDHLETLSEKERQRIFSDPNIYHKEYAACCDSYVEEDDEAK